MAVVDHRIREAPAKADGVENATGERVPEACGALAQRPAVVAAPCRHRDLFPRVLTDIGHDQAPVIHYRELPRVPETGREHLERAIRILDIESQDLAAQAVRILAGVRALTQQFNRRDAVSDGEVEQAVTSE